MNLFNLTILFLLGLAVLLAILLGIFFLLSVLSGWRELANRYRASQPFKGQTIGWQGGRMRKTVRYRTCLTFGVDSKGLFISMAPLLRPAHPSLYIPWTEIIASKGHRGFVEGVYLRFANVPGVWLFIRRRLAEKLSAKGPLQIASL